MESRWWCSSLFRNRPVLYTYEFEGKFLWGKVPVWAIPNSKTKEPLMIKGNLKTRLWVLTTMKGRSSCTARACSKRCKVQGTSSWKEVNGECIHVPRMRRALLFASVRHMDEFRILSNQWSVRREYRILTHSKFRWATWLYLRNWIMIEPAMAASS